MALPIERWARQATLLDGPPKRVQQDLNDLARYEAQFWNRQQRKVRADGDPTALESFFGGLLANPPASVISTSSVSGEVGMWPAATWTPLPANTLIAPETMRLAVSGTVVSGATPGNWTVTPRLGTSTSGGTLGASGAVALTASVTANYYLIGDLTIRSIGTGTAASAIGFFHIVGKLSATGASDINQVFGHTVATFDSSAAQGLFMGATHTVTTVTHNIQNLHWMSWN
jgi:hypothetical protein